VTWLPDWWLSGRILVAETEMRVLVAAGLFAQNEGTCTKTFDARSFILGKPQTSLNNTDHEIHFLSVG
jgi:hypothetical protein